VANNGHKARAQLILDRGAEVFEDDNDGRMPLRWLLKQHSPLCRQRIRLAVTNALASQELRFILMFASVAVVFYELMSD